MSLPVLRYLLKRNNLNSKLDDKIRLTDHLPPLTDSQTVSEYTPDIFPTHGIVLPGSGTTSLPDHGDGSSDTKPITQRQITFNGREWIAYDLRRLPDDYFEPGTFEEFHIRFKTEEPTGMLWWSGTDEKNMHISLKVVMP